MAVRVSRERKSKRETENKIENKRAWIWSRKGGDVCGKTVIDRGVIQGPVNSSLYYLNAKYSALVGIWGSSQSLALAKGRCGVAFTRISRFPVPLPGLALPRDT